jgi:hypothetical protein
MPHALRIALSSQVRLRRLWCPSTVCVVCLLFMYVIVPHALRIAVSSQVRLRKVWRSGVLFVILVFLVYVYVCVCMFIYKHQYINIHIYIYIHIHASLDDSTSGDQASIEDDDLVGEEGTRSMRNGQVRII